jgi:hypothetical protein
MSVHDGSNNGLSRCGYKHDKVVLSDTGDPAHISMPGVHRLAASLKRWLLSTHQGAVSPKYLDPFVLDAALVAAVISLRS